MREHTEFAGKYTEIAVIDMVHTLSGQENRKHYGRQKRHHKQTCRDENYNVKRRKIH